jgi:flavin reductase (DIM6/NTAB) family NADH-FMN oxidoreductase RutF/rubredoxin
MNIEAFFKLSYGLFIVSSCDDDKINAHISNTVFQVTANPPQFAVCSNKDNLTTDYIIKSKVFAVSILQQETDIQFIGIFGFKSGKKINKFESVNYRLGVTGAPIVLDKTIAYIDCKVINSIDVGSHIIFIGEAVDADIINDNAPLTYSYYRNVIKGISPKNAPTYIEKKKIASPIEQKPKNMDKYQCTVCGHIYDPAIGDDTSGIQPGTSFSDLPDDWTCPECGVNRSFYQKMI